MAELTDIDEEHIAIQATLKLVKQAKGLDDSCVGCVFVSIGNCPACLRALRCCVNGQNYIWVEV